MKMSPRQYQIKCYELKEFLIEQDLNEYIKNGGRVEDLPMNSGLMKKYNELMGYEDPEVLKKQDDGYLEKLTKDRLEKMKNGGAIADIFKNARPIKV